MWIQNVAAVDVKNGHHVAVRENSMLIQIMDPCSSWWPEPKHKFAQVHRFEFLDAEDKDGFDEDFKISDAQAQQLVGLLQHALDNNMDVVVHCMAGLCRSGAVCEVGVMMGFQDTERFRSPNMRVKHRMMRVLGWTYDENETYDEEAWRRYRGEF
jgi:predicted protein tyrosine phosphatase